MKETRNKEEQNQKTRKKRNKEPGRNERGTKTKKLRL